MQSRMKRDKETDEKNKQKRVNVKSSEEGSKIPKGLVIAMAFRPRSGSLLPEEVDELPS